MSGYSRSDHRKINDKTAKRICFNAWMTRHKDQSKRFSDKGDSGSLVTDRMNALGQIHCVSLDGALIPYATFMTPVDVILDAIKDILPGCAVELVTLTSKRNKAEVGGSSWRGFDLHSLWEGLHHLTSRN